MILSFFKISLKVMIKLAVLINDIKYCTLLKTAPDFQIDSDAAEDYS